MTRPRTRAELLEALQSAAEELFSRYYEESVSLKLVLNMSRGGGAMSYQVNVTEYLRSAPSSGGDPPR